MFHVRLKELRIKHGFTQKSLASAIGITERGYRGYESGNNSPNMEVLVKLADALSVSLDYLVGRSDDPAVH